MQMIPSLLICMSILFGIVAMAILMDIPIKQLKGFEKLVFWLGFSILLIFNFIISSFISMEHQTKHYMLLVHLPVFLIFRFVTKLSWVKILFSLYTAVFLIFPSNLVTLGISLLDVPNKALILFLSGISMSILSIFVIIRFLKTDFNYLIYNYGNRSILKLCLLPFLYNVAIYWMGQYNFTQTMKADIFPLRILLFILALVAYFLILDISRSAREKERLQNEQLLLTTQLDSAKRQISSLHTAQQQAIIYRHDLRHHFTLLSELAEIGELEKIKEYLAQVQNSVDIITPVRFCKNETLNLLISAFDRRAAKVGITLSVGIDVPQTLGIPDPELCTVLSNGLENAITAASQVSDQSHKTVRLTCKTNRDNLLILIQNAYEGKISMENDLPKPSRTGHGFGCRSIAAIAEKRNGFSNFKAQDGIFTLQIIMKLD